MVIRSQRARATRFRIDRFMSVPLDTVISPRFFQQAEDTVVFGDESVVEDPGIWRHWLTTLMTGVIR